MYDHTLQGPPDCLQDYNAPGLHLFPCRKLSSASGTYSQSVFSCFCLQFPCDHVLHGSCFGDSINIQSLLLEYVIVSYEIHSA